MWRRCILSRWLRSSILQYPRLLRARASVYLGRLQVDIAGWSRGKYAIPWRRNEGQLGVKRHPFASAHQRLYHLDLVRKWSEWSWNPLSEYSLRLVWESVRNNEVKPRGGCCVCLYPSLGCEGRNRFRIHWCRFDKYSVKLLLARSDKLWVHRNPLEARILANGKR